MAARGAPAANTGGGYHCRRAAEALADLQRQPRSVRGCRIFWARVATVASSFPPVKRMPYSRRPTFRSIRCGRRTTGNSSHKSVAPMATLHRHSSPVGGGFVVSRSGTLVSIEKAQELGCISALNLVQALADLDRTRVPRLWFVTVGTQAAGDRSSPFRLHNRPCGAWPALSGSSIRSFVARE